VITGSVLGAGAKRRWAGTRWSIAGQILIAWVVTLPCAALVGGLAALIDRAPGGQFAIYAVVAAGVIGMVALRRRLFATWEEHVAAEEAAVQPAPPVTAEPPGKKAKKAKVFA
jgi:PiT family inorganic phosphate transporter